MSAAPPQIPRSTRDKPKNDLYFSCALVVLETRWRFAKTYVESYPHEYTLDEWCDEGAFEKAIHCIERLGVVSRS
jgi:hypothetical protein